MSNLTYNPNVNIPYNNNNNNYNNNYNNNINMDFEENGGNFRQSNYEMSHQLPQMDPRGDMRGDLRVNSNMENMNSYKQNMRQPIRQNFDSYYEDNDGYDIPPTKLNKNKKKKSKYSDYDIDTFKETNSSKFDWLLFVKKLVIYTALFLIMSHVKMDELVCKFIPFLSENQILCMTVKGLLLALLIILVQMLL
jgi:hypothetical protein